jgi:hypothetical protein
MRETSIHGIEPGAGNYFKPIETRSAESEPPEGFVDNTVYVYKLDENGHEVLVGTMDPFPEGWHRTKAEREKGFQKMNEEDEDMPKARDDREEILAKARPKLAAGQKISHVAKELGVPVGTLDYWIKQTPTPEPVQAANQEPEREETEPAGNSVAQPQRTTYTSTQYQESVEKGGFTADDDKPIPYTVTKVKVNWEEVWPRAQGLLAKGMSQVAVAEQLGITIDSLRHKVERERKKKQPSKTADLDRYKVKWIRDVMLDDLDPGVQLRIVAAVQGMEI